MEAGGQRLEFPSGCWSLMIVGELPYGAMTRQTSVSVHFGGWIGGCGARTPAVTCSKGCMIGSGVYGPAARAATGSSPEAIDRFRTWCSGSAEGFWGCAHAPWIRVGRNTRSILQQGAVSRKPALCRHAMRVRPRHVGSPVGLSQGLGGSCRSHQSVWGHTYAHRRIPQ